MLISTSQVKTILSVEDYAHRVLMSLVAPVDLKVKYNVQEAEFFTTKLQFNPKPA